MADQDIQLDLKKRARRRLVGAAALALLAAIVLPLVMDKEPRMVGQEIQIRIPGQETSPPAPAERAASASVPAEAVTPAAPETAPQAPAAAAKVMPAAALPETPPATKPEAPKEAPKTIPAPARNPEPSTAKPAEKPVEKPAEKAAVAPKTETSPDAARAEAILNGGEAPAGGHYVVQLGVFSDAGNVKKLRQRVKAAGYNSFTESVESANGQRTRVRAGPFGSKEAAQKARDRLKQAGLDGIVAGK